MQNTYVPESNSDAYDPDNSLNNTVQAYHNVRGTKRYGLLVDPGAASGIIGSDTLREYVDNILVPNNMDYKIEPSAAVFKGISGQPEPGKGAVTMPMSVAGMADCTFAADVVGNAGSYCPGLLPNSSMRQHNMSLFTNIFHNGDGIL